MNDYDKFTAKKGLEGIIAGETSVSKVMPEINALVYRGYPVQDLAENCNFEEVAYLLWNGELPNKDQLENFINQEKKYRKISNDHKEVIKRFPKAHPMDYIRTGVSFLGMEDERIWDCDDKTNMDKALRIFAATPTIIAAAYRTQKGQEIIDPKDELSFSENFFNMCFGEVPEAEVVRAFDVSLTLYAEHGFNASTFTTRVITSTMSDMYSAVAGGIGSLKGPLHGGANEQVMHVLKEINDPKIAKEWMLNAIKEKRKVMGFGHRVYRKGDSRVPTMKKYAAGLGKIKGEEKWQQISDILEQTMIDEKNIHPNLDFPAGPAYYLMGFDIDMFTPIFVMSRITGWTAHIIEQTSDNRIYRPLCNYKGHMERKLTPIAQR